MHYCSHLSTQSSLLSKNARQITRGLQAIRPASVKHDELGDAVRRRHKNIILTGPPGCGKTTIAKIVGEKLRMRVIDVDDDHLEPFWGTTVAEKFSSMINRGASYDELIATECDAFRELRTDEPCVISLSGSNPVSDASRSHIESLGTTFYLDVPLGDIERRLTEIKVDRILSYDEKASMMDVLKYRTQFYNQVYDYRVMAGISETAPQIAERLLQTLKRSVSNEAHISTRAVEQDTGISFNETILESVAKDGGIFVPNFSIEPFDEQQISRMANDRLKFEEIAQRVQERFISPDQIKPRDNLRNLENTFSSFQIPNKLHVESLGDNTFVSELFHGPTASFKDFALQQLPYFYQNSALRLNDDRQKVVIVATSGDTGGAVLDGFSRMGNDNFRVLVLYPADNISDIQRDQMLSYHSPPNYQVLGLEGDFDDCQKLIKTVFQQKDVMSQKLICAANSVNWGRIVAQITMHFGTYFELTRNRMISANQKIDVAIPSGNFGNMYSCWLSKKMGLPLNRLIVASNENRILTDLINTGNFDLRNRTLVQTESPAIDILRPSNLERYLFSITNRNTEIVRHFYDSLATDGVANIRGPVHKAMSHDFEAGECKVDECKRTMNLYASSKGYMLDPHTAVGVSVASSRRSELPLVVMGTAHPMKFNYRKEASKPGLHKRLQKIQKPEHSRESCTTEQAKNRIKTLLAV